MNKCIVIAAAVSLISYGGLSFAQATDSPVVLKSIPISYYLLDNDLVLESNEAPSINFSSPAQNQTYSVGDVLVIEADANDIDGTVAKVDLRVDGSRVAGVPSAYKLPYRWSSISYSSLNLSPGMHSLEITATDNFGKISKVTRAINIVIIDDDGDGVANDEDAFPNDPTETTDRDGDGVGDNADFFPDDPERFEKITTIQLDFGREDSPSGWNAIAGRSKENLSTETGEVSDVNFVRINGTFFSGLSTSGTQTSTDIYPVEVTQDGFFGRSKPYSEFKLTGLDTASDYTLHFFASVPASTTSYQTTYTVTGQGVETTDIEPQLDQQASVTLKPSSLGELVIRIQAGVDNTNSQKTFYLNALTISHAIASDSAEPDDPIVAVYSEDIANKLSGVAPLAVNFDAGAEGEDFHNRLYEWSFGDPESGRWVGVENSVGLPKNTDTGPIAGHLYTKPGVYTAILRVSDDNGEMTHLRKKVTITVNDPNEVFAGEKTKCISNTGNFSGCPQGAEQLTYSGQQLSGNITNIIENNRLLLRRGDEWTVENENADYTAKNNVYISAYGDCNNSDARGICANAPVLSNSATGEFLRFEPKSNNILVEHVHFTATDRRYGSIGDLANPSNITFNKLKITIAEGIYSVETRNYSLVDSDLTGGHSIIIYTGGRNMIIQGNHFHDSYSSHLLRLMSPYKSVITHNVLHSVEVDPQRQSRGSMLLKLHGLDPVLNNKWLYTTQAVQPSFAQYVVVANNFFGRGGSWPVSISPSNAQWNESIKDVILEKNTHSCAYGNPTTIGTLSTLPSSDCDILLSVQAQGVTVRNNIFDLKGAGRIIDQGTNTGKTAYPSAIAVKRFALVTGAPAPQNLSVYNNTINIPTDVTYANSPRWLTSGADAVVGVGFINNLLTKPDASATQYFNDKSGGAGAVFDNNLFVDDAGFINGFDANILNRDYRLLPSSPAIDTGLELLNVIDDFNGALRSENVMDVGAYRNEN